MIAAAITNSDLELEFARLEHMRAVAGGVPLRVMEALPWEIRGLEALQRFGDLVWEQD